MFQPYIVDIHTHMYPPTYISLLRSRTTLPMVRTFPSAPEEPRLLLLESELPSLERALSSPAANTSGEPLPGRPLTKHYTDPEAKLAFMRQHGITTSVVSLANPWLDFLEDGEEAGKVAEEVNREMEEMCSKAAASQQNREGPDPLFFLAALPTTAPLEAILSLIPKLSQYAHCRGIILSTSGLGPSHSGLDDPAMLPIFHALAAAQLPIFLHPHYGLPDSVLGQNTQSKYGHVLPLAIGFPVETSIALVRMYLAGVFDTVPGLRVIIAHAGGVVPFLAGRVESCVVHDELLTKKFDNQERRTLWQVLREQVYLDAVVYSEVGLKAAVEAVGGVERVMFGTDHPFFPPVDEKYREGMEWESVRLNREAVRKTFGEGSEEERLVLGGNAVRILGLGSNTTR
ncbi:uncharacterized protein CTHT_0070690 [Thermochaetoides thermophila DSM 1495]|uniref:Amidohydrolase-related domain-containing protein n=1 Tax=Chaetomium thermophilum (strain DSM 1495 / CBS 144.50 / IMI 039719) TaxID=759272 RepID=G0SFG1_CHATD|nr:hypothetical protein CTHT_0070690 [Thermochaetoides thermophila DSM 1495]EGS17726.1 hypothetical protein CTHT_0070690 [Thermochaetoides thermophila DSM 1495]